MASKIQFDFGSYIWKFHYQNCSAAAIRIPLKTVLEKHCQETIEQRTNLKQDELPQKLYAEACSGFDASGRHSMHSNQKTETHNFIFGGCRLISLIDEHGNCIYLEESVGPDTEKPLFIQPGKETNELIEKLYSELEAEVL